MSKPISGHCPNLIESMEKAGILPDHCRRVVIEIGFDSMVTLYYETFADDRLLDIDFAAHIAVMQKENENDNQS